MCDHRVTAILNIVGLPLLATPWALSAMPWSSMWPPNAVGQYLFVCFLSTNGILLFVFLGLFYDTAVRRSVLYLIVCCNCCQCLRRRPATKVVSQPAAERDNARLVHSAKGSDRGNEPPSSSSKPLPVPMPMPTRPSFLVCAHVKFSSELLFAVMVMPSGSSGAQAAAHILVLSALSSHFRA